jgi:hypothetical protein
MTRKPFFRILEVREPEGRSIADITAEVAAERRIHIQVLRSPLMLAHILAARDEAITRIMQERPDIPSSQVAAYFNRDPSTIRYSWRRARLRSQREAA